MASFILASSWANSWAWAALPSINIFKRSATGAWMCLRCREKATACRNRSSYWMKRSSAARLGTVTSRYCRSLIRRTSICWIAWASWNPVMPALPSTNRQDVAAGGVSGSHHLAPTSTFPCTGGLNRGQLRPSGWAWSSALWWQRCCTIWVPIRCG